MLQTFLSAPDIRFPGLGIEIENLVSGITLPIGDGFVVKFYGAIIALGIVLGYTVACLFGRGKEKIDSETIADYLIYGIIFGVIGARIYYVAFEWDYYGSHLDQLLNLRGGGLAIYGGVIGSITAMYVYCRIKKIKFFALVDICMPGLMTGQMLGRWGNFFNCEAFGDYYNGFLSMMIKASKVYSGNITQKIADNLITYEGVEYISVHPTFLYESLWNCGSILIMVLIHKYKKFDGQMFYGYMILYGLGRLWIEGLRTDQLTIGNTGLAVSQLLSGALVVIGLTLTVINLIRAKKAAGQTVSESAEQAEE